MRRDPSQVALALGDLIDGGLGEAEAGRLLETYLALAERAAPAGYEYSSGLRGIVSFIRWRSVSGQSDGAIEDELRATVKAATAPLPAKTVRWLEGKRAELEQVLRTRRLRVQRLRWVRQQAARRFALHHAARAAGRGPRRHVSRAALVASGDDDDGPAAPPTPNHRSAGRGS